MGCSIGTIRKDVVFSLLMMPLHKETYRFFAQNRIQVKVFVSCHVSAHRKYVSLLIVGSSVVPSFPMTSLYFQKVLVLILFPQLKLIVQAVL